MSTEPRRDEEYYTLAVVSAVKTSLNTCIAAINAEKNDSITLAAVDSNAYYYATFGRDAPAYDPAVIFDVDTEEGETLAGTDSEQISVTVEMVVSNKLIASHEDLLKVICRYRRAIKDALKANLRKLPRYQLVSLPRMTFTASQDDVRQVLGVGVRFKFVN